MQEAFIQATEEGKRAQAAIVRTPSNSGTYGEKKYAGVDALLVR